MTRDEIRAAMVPFVDFLDIIESVLGGTAWSMLDMDSVCTFAPEFTGIDVALLFEDFRNLKRAAAFLESLVTREL